LSAVHVDSREILNAHVRNLSFRME
jgi:hypothetical protein